MGGFSTICFGLLVYLCQATAEPPPKTTTVVCPPLIEIPAAQQRRIGERLAALNDPDLNALAGYFRDQRNVNRRCRASGGNK